jgi:hypothetical protein
MMGLGGRMTVLMMLPVLVYECNDGVDDDDDDCDNHGQIVTLAK